MRVAGNSLLAPRRWGTIVEATLALTIATAATRLLPFKRYIGLGALPIREVKQAHSPEIARIVDALGRRLPLRAVCLQQGIAFQWMLRRRGIDAVLHYGIRLPEAADAMEAHVWVSVDRNVVLGTPQHQRFTEVARYPS